MLRKLTLLAPLALTLAADCDGVTPPLPDAGPEEEPDCIIGDPEAQAEFVLVARLPEGGFVDIADGDDVPLILPPQGGKVTLIGVRAKNVTCRVLMNAGLFDECASTFVGLDARPVQFEEGADGFGTPALPDTLQNYANIPVCPSFGSLRDGDEEPYGLQMRITEQRRNGEDAPRVHTIEATVTPFCAEEDILGECTCECDADFVLEVPQDQQCPTIHDNDTEPGVCPEAGE